MTTSYTSNNSARAGRLDGGGGTVVEVVSLHRVVAWDNSNDEEEAVIIEVTMKA